MSATTTTRISRKANKDTLPSLARRRAYKAPGVSWLLPTGAKVFYVRGQGYFVHGYHCEGEDIAPYLKEAPDGKEA